MVRVLVTGMSGTGKSAALAALGGRGYRVLETDDLPWSEWSETDGGYVWREDVMSSLLARDDGEPLFVSGCVSNQGRFYSRFDAVVLLSAPAEVILRRVEGRTKNDYGKRPDERERILFDLRVVEPLLRATCTHELDATRPLDEVVDALIAIARAPAA